MTINNDEVCKLVNNTSKTKWKVVTTNGVECQVSSVCLLIPPPDPVATEAVERLKRQYVHWMSYTYLYIRIIRSPQLYGISVDTLKEDPTLEQHHAKLIHTAAVSLEKSQLLKYDRKSGQLQGNWSLVII